MIAPISFGYGGKNVCLSKSQLVDTFRISGSLARSFAFYTNAT